MTDNQDQPLSRRAIREREAAEAARAAGGVPTPAQPTSSAPVTAQPGTSQPATESSAGYRVHDFSPEGRRAARSPWGVAEGEGADLDYRTENRAPQPTAAPAQPSQAPVTASDAAGFTDTAAPVTSGLTRRELRAIREAQEQGQPGTPAAWQDATSASPVASPAPAPGDAVPSPPPSFDALLAGDSLTNSDAAPASPLGGPASAAPVVPAAPAFSPSSPPALIEPEEPRDAASSLEALLGGSTASWSQPSAQPAVAPTPQPVAEEPQPAVVEAEPVTLEPAPVTSEPAPVTIEPVDAPSTPSWVQADVAPESSDTASAAPVFAAPVSAAPIPAPQTPAQETPAEAFAGWGAPAVPVPVEQPAPVDEPTSDVVSQPPYPPFPSLSVESAPVDAAPLDAAESVEPVEATTGERPRNHWSRQAELDDEAQPATGGLSRQVGGTATGNALVLPEVPNTDLIGTTIGRTGDVVVTGSISLPASLASTGALDTQLDESDLDNLLDPGDHQVVSTQSQPVRAVRAVSTHTSSRELLGPVKPPKRGNRALTALIIAAGAMAVVVVTLLVVALTSGVLG